MREWCLQLMLVFNGAALVSLLHLQRNHEQHTENRGHVPICHPLKVDLFQCYYVHYASCGSVHRTMIWVYFFFHFSGVFHSVTVQQKCGLMPALWGKPTSQDNKRLWDASTIIRITSWMSLTLLQNTACIFFSLFSTGENWIIKYWNGFFLLLLSLAGL